MRIIYDNIIFSLQKAGGISVYWSELIKRIGKPDVDVEFYGEQGDNIFERNLDVLVHQERNLPIWILRYLPFTKRLPPHTIFHSSYYRVSTQKRVRNIVTVHDFVYEHFSSGLRKYVHVMQKSFALSRASGIICISEHTKKDLDFFYPHIRCPVVIIPHGVSDDFMLLSEKERILSQPFEVLQDTPFVLFVGGRSNYKNFATAVNAVAKMAGHQLVIIGGGPLSHQHAQLLNEKLSERHYHFLNVTETELNLLYNNAFCLMYPSRYEGFGLPVLESMKAGCPVVALRASSIPEVVGDAALLAESEEPIEFISKMNELLDVSVRRALIEKGLHRVKNFDWDICFQKTYAFYKKIDTLK